MRNTKLKTNRLLTSLPYLLIFMVSATYFLWFASYIFFYQEKSMLFLVSTDFLFKHLDQPGGFLEYLGIFFTTFYYHEVAGAVLLSFIILLVSWVLSLIGKNISGKQVYVLPFMIGAGLVYLQTHYQYAVFNTLGILLQLVLFYFIIRFLKGKREWLPVVLFPFWYFLTGGFAWLFFVLFLLFLISERGKAWWLKLLTLFSLALLFFFISKEFLFYETPEILLLFPFSFQEVGMQIREFIFLIVLISVSPLIFRIKFYSSAKKTGRKFLWPQLMPFVVIFMLAGMLISRIDKKNNHYFYVEKLFYRQQYDKIISFNLQFPSTNKLTLFLNNIALVEDGLLTERMFDFPQNPDGSTLFLKWENVGEVLKRGGYFYYTVGMINEAQRWAYEYMVMRGYTPEGLKMLIKTELINGNYKVAEKYISILKHSVFYQKEASAFEELLFNDAAVDKHPELGRKKRLKPKADFFVLSDEPDANISYIVAADSANVVAVEYHFAWLLLHKDVEAVVKNLPLLERVGYDHIPHHIEEAAVGFKLLQMGEFPKLEYLSASDETEQRFSQYYRVFQQNSASHQQAQWALHQNFSGSFWYYLFFS